MFVEPMRTTLRRSHTPCPPLRQVCPSAERSHILSPPLTTRVLFVFRDNQRLMCCLTQGGFIFPLFFAGASLGRALLSVTDEVLSPALVVAGPALLCMCFAAGLNVAITRTPFASPLILACLSGQSNITTPALCAALASLFVTRSSKFIGPQRDRSDIQFIGDLQPLEQSSSNSALSLSQSGVDEVHTSTNGNGRAPDEETGSLLEAMASVKVPLPDYSVTSEASTIGGNDPVATAEEKPEEESPATASYRQGELIKVMVGDMKLRPG